MTIDYDPYSHEAMSNPTDLYKQMREAGCPHYIEKYNAWALTRFDDVTRASLAEDKLDFSHGSLLGQVLFDEPVPRTFMTMNGADHRRWRSLLQSSYTPKAVKAEAERLQGLVRKLLAPLVARGEFDVYRDFANRVLCINAGYLLGIPREDAERCRALIDDMILLREPGQRGMTSPRNHAAAQELGEYLAAYVARLRADPSLAVRHAKILLDAEVDGVRLNDEDLVAYFFSLLVTGSETTPMATAATLYYLHKHPEQKAMVLADPSLCKAAFVEALRFDQPTNMLARCVRSDFELGGKTLREGDRLLMIYASANRDADHFDRPDEFDIRRPARADLSFGTGTHFCLGTHLALLVGPMMIREILSAVGDYELIEDQCERAYGENLAGFTHVPIRFDASRAGSIA